MVQSTNTSASTKIIQATEMPSLTLTSLSSGPKYFPHGWCESSSIDDLSSSQEDLAMPGADEQEEEPHDPESGDEDRDQRVEHLPHEPERPEDEPESAPLDEEVGEDIEPLAPEATMRRDLRAEATSLRHLLTHLPKNPYCILPKS